MSPSQRRLRRPKGTRDILPPETADWAAVEEQARVVFGRYGFGEIRTPIFESTELFVRGVGESSDIVGKEMYSFESRGGDALTLRPESTASVARAFVENGLQQRPSPLKLFYMGPQFRYERPQAGRYRQFSQIGAELLGNAGPVSDAELIAMLMAFLRSLHFESLTVLLNTLGDAESRLRYREALIAYFEPLQGQLGDDSRRRLASNPLRILDTKVAAERELLADAPRLADLLTEEAKTHFNQLCQLLDRLGIRYRLEDRLVRGLDYYTGTVFEIVAEGLGSQDAIVGGGRYDRLISDLGGPEIPGIGFAIGEDRLLAILPASFRSQAAPPRPVLVVGAPGAGGSADSGDSGDSEKLVAQSAEGGEALALAEELRAAGVNVIADFGNRSVRNAVKRADRLGASFLAFLGEEELAAGEVTIKDLDSGDQRRLSRAAAVETLASEARQKTPDRGQEDRT